VKGLELARRYFTDVVFPAFQKRAPAELGRLAFGLAGPGSECYGLDDQISRDHDWGPRVWVWVPEALFREQGEALQQIYDELEPVFLGHGPVHRLDTRVRRDGVTSIPRFYQAHLGTDLPPETLRDWLLLPEEGLSTCTNGEVFLDPFGEFTRQREALLSYFPRDLWLKKIASRCRAAAAHGQYNLWRALRRGDRLTAHHHQAGFAREAAVLVFLLRRTYRPFGKWLFHGLQAFQALSGLGPAVHGSLLAVIDSNSKEPMQAAVERSAGLLADELVAQGLADRRGSFLRDYALQIEGTIEDATLREGLGSVE
jgi:hypothetical protein